MRTTKKLTALVLAGALLGSSVGAAPASARSFGDVPAGHWAREVVDIVSDRGIMVGMAADAFFARHAVHAGAVHCYSLQSGAG